MREREREEEIGRKRERERLGLCDEVVWWIEGWIRRGGLGVETMAFGAREVGKLV